MNSALGFHHLKISISSYKRKYMLLTLYVFFTYSCLYTTRSIGNSCPKLKATGIGSLGSRVHVSLRLRKFLIMRLNLLFYYVLFEM
jgi:hypothetical protein